MNEDPNSNILSFQENYDQEDTPYMPENLQKSGIPFLTQYISLFGRSGFWYVKDEKLMTLHYNHIKVSFLYTVCHILLISSFFIWKFVAYDYYFDRLTGFFYFMLTLYVIILISMYRTIFTNPYLPFYYPAQNDRRTFSKIDYRLGYAYKKEQIKWARKQKKPNRSTFSEHAGYFVIRADHYCAWVRNWISYKNHRFFLIFVGFSAFYMIILLLTFCHLFLFHMKEFSFFCHAFDISLSGFFSFIFTVQTCYQYYHVSINKTLLEKLKKQNRFYDRGCLNNWSEVCGQKKLICIWPFPCISLNTAYNPFNYPEYVGPSYLDNMIKNENDDDDDDDDILFNKVDDMNDNNKSLL